jgi:hypothetical protein
MKHIFTIIFICAVLPCAAQKYILLDKTMAEPMVMTNKITIAEKYKNFFPIEKKDISVFIKTLEEISERLSSKKITGKAKDYQIGCTEFLGRVFPLESGERLDYVLISTCDDIKVPMHLVDAKLDNANNAYFVNAWIKYIKSNYHEYLTLHKKMPVKKRS